MNKMNKTVSSRVGANLAFALSSHIAHLFGGRGKKFFALTPCEAHLSGGEAASSCAAHLSVAKQLFISRVAALSRIALFGLLFTCSAYWRDPDLQPRKTVQGWRQWPSSLPGWDWWTRPPI